MQGTANGSGVDYLAWNDAIASHFFRPAAADQSVYLFVTEQLVGEIGRALDGGVDQFVAAVRAGPPGVTRSGHCQRALQVAATWRSSGRKYPPYIAYLALFVLAGGHEGEFAPHAYYPRLWDLLGEQGTGRPPSFDRMFELWDDLEQWSVRDCDGELGAFQARIVGGWVHVGMPLAQTVLTEAERRALPRVFADADLEPGTALSGRELRRALITCGRAAGLRPRTLTVLEQAAGGFSEAVLDVAADDFEAWDGESAAGSTSAVSGRRISAGMRLCLALDRVSGRLSSQLRCHSRKELPEDGLALAAGRLEELSCSEFITGWSTPLTVAASGEPFRPPAGAWAAGLSVMANEAGWRLSLRPARARTFVEGSAEGLPGLVEVLELPRRRPFYLAFARNAWPLLSSWLEGECHGWRPIEIREGLREDWTFGAVSEAYDDAGLRQVEPRLAFTDRVSMRMVGGVRVGVGNSYLHVAPPRLLVHGAADGDILYCAGRPTAIGPQLEEACSLPDGLPEDARITLEVRRGETVIRRSSIYLLSGFSWRMAEPIVTLDRFGGPAEDSAGVSGALVKWRPSTHLVPDLLRTPGLRNWSGRVYFLGCTPNQIASWPREPLPEEWMPVWAIRLGERHGRALFCGTSLREAEPVTPSRRASGRRAKMWAALLGRHPHRVTPPQDAALKLLWRRYREAARALR